MADLARYKIEMDEFVRTNRASEKKKSDAEGDFTNDESDLSRSQH